MSSKTTTTTNMRLTMEDAIERLGMGRFQWRMFVAAGWNAAADAMEILLLSFLQIVVRMEFDQGTHEASLLTSAVFVGAFFGTLTFGALGDAYGRKPTFLASAMVISASGIATACVNSYQAMVVFRFGVGFGLGGNVVPYDAMAELLPQRDRGRFLLYIGYFWTVGTCAVPALAYLGLQEAGSWRLFVILCSIPCVLATLLAMIWVPESPRWLLEHGHKDQAMETLRHGAIVNRKEDPLQTFPEGMELINDPNEEHGMHSIGFLFSKDWRRLTLTVWGMWAGLSFMYWGTIQLVTLVFSSDGVEVTAEGGDYVFDYGAILGSSAAEFVGTTMSILFVDRLGRITLMSSFYTLSGVFIVGLCIMTEAQSTSRAGLIALAFFARMFTSAATQLSWLVTAELIPTQIRNTGHATASAVARIGGIASPWLVSPDNSFQTIGIAMGAVCLYTSIVVCFLPETQGRALGTAASFVDRDDNGNPKTSEII